MTHKSSLMQHTIFIMCYNWKPTDNNCVVLGGELEASVGYFIGKNGYLQWIPGTNFGNFISKASKLEGEMLCQLNLLEIGINQFCQKL